MPRVAKVGLVWEIERRLARDASRPIIFYTRAATCWRPRVKGLNLVVNSVFNSWGFEELRMRTKLGTGQSGTTTSITRASARSQAVIGSSATFSAPSDDIPS